MTTIRWSGLATILLTLMTAYPMGAQTAPVAPRTGVPATAPKSTTPIRPGRRQPCWQVAGVSKSAIQQHRQIEESTRSQVESVCSDSSLTPQQKQAKIHQLREQAHQQMASVISPQQQAALRSCREQRGEGQMGGMHGGSGLGPCGEATPGTGTKP